MTGAPSNQQPARLVVGRFPESPSHQPGGRAGHQGGTSPGRTTLAARPPAWLVAGRFPVPDWCLGDSQNHPTTPASHWATVVG